jgi:ubiquinone/menaquinone biosynthesis C-methylase UbiE
MKSFDKQWDTIYGDSTDKHFNKYPYGQLVTYFFRNLKFIKNRGNDTKILELGCGTGNNLPLVLNEGFIAYGIDGSQKAIEIAQNRLKTYKNIHLDVMDFTELKYNDNFFDMIFDRQSIYANRIGDIEIIYKEISRLLKKDGIFISLMYNTDDYHFLKIKNNRSYAQKIEYNTFTNFIGGTFQDTGVVHFFTKEEIFKLCDRSGLDILSLSKSEINEFYPNSSNKISEYILVAKKC